MILEAGRCLEQLVVPKERGLGSRQPWGRCQLASGPSAQPGEGRARGPWRHRWHPWLAVDGGTALGSGTACGRHHAVSLPVRALRPPPCSPLAGESQSHQAAAARKGTEGKEGRRGQRHCRPHSAVGVAPREPEVLRHRRVTDLPGSRGGPFPSFPLAGSYRSPVG